MRAAAEAVIELLGRAHGEGRRFLAVERAARDVIRAGALQLHVPIHHFDDVDPAEKVLDEGLRNHARKGRCGK
ncbi:hypothetical protein D3C83_121990 [compost metagenome]